MANEERATLLSKAGGDDTPLDINADDFSERLFSQYRKRLGSREGGIDHDPNPTAGLTYKGITQDTVNRLRGVPGGRWSSLPQLPTQLSDQQIDDIYREQYFDVGRVPIVAGMPGLLEKTPELPEQLFDSSVQHNPHAAGKFLQRALEDTLKSKDLRDAQSGAYSGNIGPKTQAALRQAIAEGKLDAVNDRMAEIRLEAMKNGYTWKQYPAKRKGLERRALSFLTSKRPKPPALR